MRRLKTAPDPWFELPAGLPIAAGRGTLARPGRHATALAPAPARPGRWLVLATRPLAGAGLVVGTAWGLATLPFRLVFGLFGLIGRILALAVGFSLMVFGAALLAGPLVPVGIPLFAIGLLLSMRSLG